MRRLAIALALVLLLASAARQDSRAEPPAPPQAGGCMFTLESAPSTIGADGRKVVNWVVRCHRRG